MATLLYETQYSVIPHLCHLLQKLHDRDKKQDSVTTLNSVIFYNRFMTETTNKTLLQCSSLSSSTTDLGQSQETRLCHNAHLCHLLQIYDRTAASCNVNRCSDYPENFPQMSHVIWSLKGCCGN